MVNQENVTVIQKNKIPAAKVTGTFTFLRDMGKKLGKDEAIQVTADDAAEAGRIQNRWRSYFKDKGHTRRETGADNKITVYLWLET